MNSKQFLRLPEKKQIELIGNRLLELYAEGKKTDAFKNDELNFSWSAANGYLKELGYKMDNTDYTLFRFARDGEKVVSEKEINRLLEQAENGLVKEEQLVKAQEEINRLKEMLKDKESFCNDSDKIKQALEEKVLEYKDNEKILFCVKIPKEINAGWKCFAQKLLYEKSVTASMALLNFIEEYKAGNVQSDEIINRIKGNKEKGHISFSMHLPKTLVDEWKSICKDSLVFNIGQMTECALEKFMETYSKNL